MKRVLAVLIVAVSLTATGGPPAMASTASHTLTGHARHYNPHKYLRKQIPDWFERKLKLLRGCENYGSYRQVVWNDFYGAYQFTYPTWRSLGYKIQPWKASPPLQDWAAYRLWRRDGGSPWPICRHRAGL